MYFKYPKHHRRPQFQGGTNDLNHLKAKVKGPEITQFLEMKDIIDEHISDNNTDGFALGQQTGFALLYFQFCLNNRHGSFVSRAM